MKVHKLMLAGLLACAFAPAVAGDFDAGAGQPGKDSQIVRISTAHIDGALPLGFAGPARLRLAPVKDAPYSAEAVTEHQQHLADGNQIVIRNTSMNYRDSAGRTRQEIRNDKGEVQVVTITDPVAGASWVLHPKDMSATRLPREGDFGRIAAQAAADARNRVEQLRKEGKLPAVERRSGPDGEEIIVKHVQRDGGEAARKIAQEVRIRVAGAMEDGSMERELHAQLAPLLSGAFGDAKWSAGAATKDLGNRDFDGVKAEGKLRSYEIPAGAVGNRAPIVVTDETWYAPDLQVTVYSKHSDPRSGDTVFHLEGLRRGEPAPALFAVPADYKVKDVAVRAQVLTKRAK